jgi:hypothetical protein
LGRGSDGHLARVAGAKSHKQPCWPWTQSYRNIAPQPFDHSLELWAICSMIRRSLDDPAKTKTYLDIAAKVLIDIAAATHFPR